MRSPRSSTFSMLSTMVALTPSTAACTAATREGDGVLATVAAAAARRGANARSSEWGAAAAAAAPWRATKSEATASRKAKGGARPRDWGVTAQ
jgi:hypothetical protein